jgi:hypothetical protein
VGKEYQYNIDINNIFVASRQIINLFHLNRVVNHPGAGSTIGRAG